MQSAAEAALTDVLPAPVVKATAACLAFPLSLICLRTALLVSVLRPAGPAPALPAPLHQQLRKTASTHSPGFRPSPDLCGHDDFNFYSVVCSKVVVSRAPLMSIDRVTSKRLLLLPMVTKVNKCNWLEDSLHAIATSLPPSAGGSSGCLVSDSRSSSCDTFFLTPPPFVCLKPQCRAPATCWGRKCMATD